MFGCRITNFKIFKIRGIDVCPVLMIWYLVDEESPRKSMNGCVLDILPKEEENKREKMKFKVQRV
ncbi:protein prune-like protein [Corchorus olitorius]|uniref:Protein prune-like protein n=1 Tax=Corchorus olitorius TaxID=93759 RepID=A0A1R3GDV7_9ROSI|nr:protein prune-like protein [Corchorus olitorius]